VVRLSSNFALVKSHRDKHTNFGAEDKAMNRGGWLHYCIIAKDSTLHDAIELCRHWDEFFELNILACWLYFPGAEWTTWVGNRYRQQMLQLSIVMLSENGMLSTHALITDGFDNQEHSTLRLTQIITRCASARPKWESVSWTRISLFPLSRSHQS